MVDAKEGTPLEGGVASDVRIVEGPDGPLVIKQALPKLKVAADWSSDPARSLIEVAAIDTFAQLGGADVVPQVVWTMPDEHRFAMRLVDPRLRNWKEDLLAGKVDIATARRVGEILGRFHGASQGDDAIALRFDNLGFFRELRIEPFFEYVARAKPDLSERIGQTARSLLEDRTVLVHGDYSPKNILADGADAVILDFEVAHWGNPRFDVAFCLAHLMLKSTLLPGGPEPLMDAIAAFLDGYRRNGPAVFDSRLSHVTGCLLLARLFGKSPVDYRDRLDQLAVEARAVGLIRSTTPPELADFSI